jgi:hypothetical protein
MATIETKPLPPPNSSANTIAEAERAQMMRPQENNDDLLQPWLVRALTGRL